MLEKTTCRNFCQKGPLWVAAPLTQATRAPAAVAVAGTSASVPRHPAASGGGGMAATSACRQWRWRHAMPRQPAASGGGGMPCQATCRQCERRQGVFFGRRGSFLAFQWQRWSHPSKIRTSGRYELLWAGYVYIFTKNFIGNPKEIILVR
jgi:hypothetical protein